MIEHESMREYTPEEAYEKGYADGKKDAIHNEPLKGTMQIGQVITGKIVSLDAEAGLASVHWDPYDKGDTNNT